MTTRVARRRTPSLDDPGRPVGTPHRVAHVAATKETCAARSSESDGFRRRALEADRRRRRVEPRPPRARGERLQERRQRRPWARRGRRAGTPPPLDDAPNLGDGERAETERRRPVVERVDPDHVAHVALLDCEAALRRDRLGRLDLLVVDVLADVNGKLATAEDAEAQRPEQKPKSERSES